MFHTLNIINVFHVIQSFNFAIIRYWREREREGGGEGGHYLCILLIEMLVCIFIYFNEYHDICSHNQHGWWSLYHYFDNRTLGYFSPIFSFVRWLLFSTFYEAWESWPSEAQWRPLSAFSFPTPLLDSSADPRFGKQNRRKTKQKQQQLTWCAVT